MHFLNEQLNWFSTHFISNTKPIRHYVKLKGFLRFSFEFQWIFSNIFHIIYTGNLWRWITVSFMYGGQITHCFGGVIRQMKSINNPLWRSAGPEKTLERSSYPNLPTWKRETVILHRHRWRRIGAGLVVVGCRSAARSLCGSSLLSCELSPGLKPFFSFSLIQIIQNNAWGSLALAATNNYR